ncbi:sugar ABC transporter permease [Halobacillus salinarum]|uniref:Sugar ABC transporter permease n=1 Tax=Halobacillus salinarum TaxID=2932257 RepID=A0ABY4EJ26_9BACI|nr:sugar ABC transporter permease [Halobacillus salinarum]UOQ44052.1 sugar ABC transporter permease [Halobacillus salinarum]
MKREQKKKLQAYWFVLPALVFFLLLIAYPLVKVLVDSFQYKTLLNPGQSAFAGFANYLNVIKGEYFSTALWNTVIWTFLSVAGEYVLGITSALALNQNVKGRGFFRGVIVIPWVVPIVVAGMTWQWMLAPDYGIINNWLVNIGILDEPYYWLGETDTALLTVTFVNIWRSFPFYTISLLAALQSVPKELIEAAVIDGAGIRTRFFKIILPQLKSVSLVLIFIHIIWTAVNFEFIWIMTEGGPLHASETLPIQIYRLAMKEFNVGAASSLASIMLVMMIIGFGAYFLITTLKRRNIKKRSEMT